MFPNSFSHSILPFFVSRCSRRHSAHPLCFLAKQLPFSCFASPVSVPAPAPRPGEGGPDARVWAASSGFADCSATEPHAPSLVLSNLASVRTRAGSLSARGSCPRAVYQKGRPCALRARRHGRRPVSPPGLAPRGRACIYSVVPASRIQKAGG